MTFDAGSSDLPYGEQVVSWTTILGDLIADDWTDIWHDDASARELHRLRGLATAQFGETESVLSELARLLSPDASTRVPAGPLLATVKSKLSKEFLADHARRIQLIETARDRRNRLVHDTISIGSTWQRGSYVPVIALMGTEEISEQELRNDLAQQQNATEAAVALLLAVDERRRQCERLQSEDQ